MLCKARVMTAIHHSDCSGVPLPSSIRRAIQVEGTRTQIVNGRVDHKALVPPGLGVLVHTIKERGGDDSGAQFFVKAGYGGLEHGALKGTVVDITKGGLHQAAAVAKLAGFGVDAHGTQSHVPDGAITGG